MTNNRQNFEQQISKELDISRKQKNATRLHYYSTIDRNTTAIASYEQFVESWAYQHWLKQNQFEIDKFIEDQHNRFRQKWAR